MGIRDKPIAPGSPLFCRERTGFGVKSSQYVAFGVGVPVATNGGGYGAGRLIELSEIYNIACAGERVGNTATQDAIVRHARSPFVSWMQPLTLSCSTIT